MKGTETCVGCGRTLAYEFYYCEECGKGNMFGLTNALRKACALD